MIESIQRGYSDVSVGDAVGNTATITIPNSVVVAKSILLVDFVYLQDASNLPSARITGTTTITLTRRTTTGFDLNFQAEWQVVEYK